MTLTMIDMGISNLGSVLQALARVGTDVHVTRDRGDVERADALVLPGVGAFGDAMTALRDLRLVDPLRRHALELGRPLVGICLGMQLLSEGSEEHGSHEGLGILPGRTTRLRPADESLRVPNIGWNDVSVRNGSLLFARTRPGEPFYFAHSYHVECDRPDDVAATIDYGGTITAAVEAANVFGLQFHPEKSQDAGLDVLASFVAAAA